MKKQEGTQEVGKRLESLDVLRASRSSVASVAKQSPLCHREEWNEKAIYGDRFTALAMTFMPVMGIREIATHPSGIRNDMRGIASLRSQ